MALKWAMARAMDHPWRNHGMSWMDTHGITMACHGLSNYLMHYCNAPQIDKLMDVWTCQISKNLPILFLDISVRRLWQIHGK